MPTKIILIGAMKMVGEGVLLTCLAMINCASKGYNKNILEVRDIIAAAKIITVKNKNYLG